MVMTKKQKDDLHLAIHEYLLSMDYGQAAQALAKEASIPNVQGTTTAGKVGLLEKKWTSVIRLQKKVMDLEAKIETMGSDSSQNIANSANRNPHFLPCSPAMHELSGHRSPVSSVAFHPTYSLAVSCGEDAGIYAVFISYLKVRFLLSFSPYCLLLP
jgi:platelet-activating factor acetylhydrolase IB subunit alpha